MSDEADLAADTEALHLAAALRVRQPTVEATGFCANCNEKVNLQRVFCSSDCSSDWHWMQKLRKLAGYQ